MAVSTDAMYNASSRYLHEKYLIHFPDMEVLEVTKANYLMSAKVLEEAYKTSSTPFGDVTSNELELSLFNENNIFSPGNASSPYAGKIQRGIKIEAFIRPDDATEWDPLGVFYVTSWSVSSAGTAANVTANDSLYSVLNAPVPSMIIYRNVVFKQFIEEYFALFNLSVDVDSSIQLTLPYVFTSGYKDNREFLVSLLTAALADCFCDHTGKVVVISKVKARSVRATLTDNDQVVSIEVKQSIETDYDSAAVTYKMWQESVEKELLGLKDSVVPAGTSRMAVTNFSSSMVASVHSIRASVKPVSFEATADHIELVLYSTEETTTDMSVVGTVLEAVESTVATSGTASVDVKSNFIQSKSVADAVCEYTDAYVNAGIPSLNMVVRGNPRLNLGDKLVINSTKYALAYTGIITRASYDYSGGLTCDLSLVAAQA